MLGDFTGGRLALEVIHRYQHCKLVKTPSFDCTAPLPFVLTEKWQLKRIRTSRIYSVFVGKLGLPQVRDCKGDCVWRRL